MLELENVANPATIYRWIDKIGDECEQETDRSNSSRLSKHDMVRIGSENFDQFNHLLLSHSLSKISPEDKIIIDTDASFIETFGQQ